MELNCYRCGSHSGNHLCERCVALGRAGAAHGPNVIYMGDAQYFEVLRNLRISDPFDKKVERYAGMTIIRVRMPSWLHVANVEGA